MLNLRTRYQLSRHYDVASGATITEEGLGLILVDDLGIAKVQPCSGAGSEVFAGVSLSHTMLPTSFPYIGTVTAVGVTLTLPFTPISGQLRLVIGTTVQNAGNPANANEYSIVGNVVTLHSAHANADVDVQLRYEPTVLQALNLYGEGFPGAQASQQIQGRVGVITKGFVHTSCYDASVAYTAGTPVYTAANGFFTSASGGTLLDKVIVAQVPSAEQAFLVLDLL